jgi:rhodanese-related sulfurtransferase
MKFLKNTEILTKSNILTAILITVISSLIGIIYNFLLPKPLDFIYTPKKIEITNDSLLFNNNQNIDTIAQTENKNKQAEMMSTATIEKQADKTKDTVKLLTDKTNSKDETINKNETKFHFVSYSQMKKILNQKDFIIIDARQPESYSKGHIPGARNIFALDDPNEKVPKIFDLPADKKIVVYCDGGACDLSEELAKELIGSFGFKQVFVYAGGWAEWEEKEK